MEPPKIIRLKATTSDGKCSYSYYKTNRDTIRENRRLNPKEHQAIVDATSLFELGLLSKAKEILENAGLIVE